MAKKMKTDRIYRIFLFIMLTFVFGYLIGGEMLLPSEWEPLDSFYSDYSQSWCRVYQDGSKEEVTIPSFVKVNEGEMVVYESVLPDEELLDKSLIFWNEFDGVEILVDGQTRLIQDTMRSHGIGRISPAGNIVFELRHEDAGKTITLKLRSAVNYSYPLHTMQYGDKFGIWMSIIYRNIATVVAAFLSLLLAVVCIVISNIFERSMNQEIALKYLGWGVLTTSMWVIANSELRQLIFHNISVIHDLAFIIPTMLAMPFLAYINIAQRRRYNKLFHIAELYVFIDFSISNLVVVFGKAKYTEIFIFAITGCVISVLLIIFTICYDMYKKRIHRYFWPAMSILIICLSGLVQIAFFEMKADASYTGATIAVALLLMIIVAMFGTIKDVVRMMRERDEAVYASKSKAQFLANMSHEIRTPINAVLGMNEMILRESKEPEILGYAADIQSAGKSLLALINDILDFSKIESGKMEIIPVEYEISSLINDSYNLLMQRAADKGLELKIEHNPAIPRRLFGDEVRVRQIIVNLLTNGIKYTEHGSVTLMLDYERLDNDNITLKIAVKDTGIGISEENQRKLFQSFQRVDEKKNRSIEGTGLGLSITKQLLDLMGGSIKVESEYGKGSVFSVGLPQKVMIWEQTGNLDNRNKALKQMEAVAVAEAEGFEAPNAKILIVDDVKINIKVMAGLLKKTKIKVDTALSGKECLEKVCQTQYDMIFLDHMMPEMDGIETYRNMQTLEGNLNKSVPVIMLTANAISGARDGYLSEGFSDYLSKPIEYDQLEDMLKRYLNKTN